MTSKRTIIILTIFSLWLLPSKGETQEMPDSLILEMERTYNKERKLEILWSIVRKTYRIPDYDTTIYFAHRQLDLATKIQNQRGHVNALWAIGLSFKKKEDFKKAGLFLLKAYQKYKYMNDDKNIAVSSHHLGQVLVETNDFEIALVYLQESLKNYQKLGDSTSVAILYYDIGRCFGSLNQFEKSFNHLEYSLTMNKKDNDANLKSKIYNIKGFNYYRLKEYKKAIKAYSKAKEYAEGLDDFEKKSAFAYNNIGEVYIEMEDFQNAKKHFEKALFFKRNLGDSELLAGTLINMAKLALLENQPSKSITYLEEIIQLLDKDRFSNNLSEASVLLAKAYKRKKDLTQRDLDKIMALNEQYAHHISDLKQAEVRQSMISTLSKGKLENETQYLQEKVEKTQYLTLRIIGLLLIIVVIFFVLLRRKERKFKLFIQQMWKDIKDI